MIKRVLLFLCIFFCYSTPLMATDFRNETIKICNDVAEWPPYTYFVRLNGNKTQKLAGFSVELVHEILNREGVDYEITMLPWKRCLANVEYGKTEMLLDATYNKNRDKKYYISKPCYITNAYYFYSKKHHPEGLNIKTLEELEQYRIGGRLGFNYKPYGIEDSELHSTTNTFQSLIDVVHSNRCDLFIEKLEVLVGFFSVNGHNLSDSDLAYAPLPEIEPEPFYFMFTRNDRGRKLKAIIDNGIDRLEKNGHLQELLKKHVP
jgi:polar amino acid transport system substrate-binding protein